MTTPIAREDQRDPRFTRFNITKGQSDVIKKTFPQYEEEYRRLNPSLVGWTKMNVSDRNTLVLLQEKLIQECMVHERFTNGTKLDSATSAQEWKKCFKTMYKNFGDNLKKTRSSQQSEAVLGLSAGRGITISDEAIHKLGKMLRLSGNLTGRQWFELSMKDELKKEVDQKKFDAESRGDVFNYGAEYQNTLKGLWNTLSAEEVGVWDEDAKLVKRDVEVNRQDLRAVLPDFVDTLVSDKVVGPALAHIFIAFRDQAGVPKVISYGNTLDGRSLTSLWTKHEPGQTEQERRESWLTRRAQQSHEMLPISSQTHVYPREFPYFLPFDKEKTLPTQWLTFIRTHFEAVWNYTNPTVSLSYHALTIAPQKYYDTAEHVLPVPLRDPAVQPYTLNECLLLLEYLKRECMAGADKPFCFYELSKQPALSSGDQPGPVPLKDCHAHDDTSQTDRASTPTVNMPKDLTAASSKSNALTLTPTDSTSIPPSRLKDTSLLPSKLKDRTLVTPSSSKSGSLSPSKLEGRTVILPSLLKDAVLLAPKLDDRMTVIPSRSKGGSLSSSKLEDGTSVLILTPPKIQKGDGGIEMDMDSPSSPLTDDGDLESQLKGFFAQVDETVQEDLDDHNGVSRDEEENDETEMPTETQKGAPSGPRQGIRRKGKKAKKATTSGTKKAGDMPAKASGGTKRK